MKNIVNGARSKYLFIISVNAIHSHRCSPKMSIIIRATDEFRELAKQLCFNINDLVAFTGKERTWRVAKSSLSQHPAFRPLMQRYHAEMVCANTDKVNLTALNSYHSSLISMNAQKTGNDGLDIRRVQIGFC